MRAPLLPKLRGQFAEFLRESSLAPLGILYLPTCVGFRYREWICFISKERCSSFSWKCDITSVSFPKKRNGIMPWL